MTWQNGRELATYTDGTNSVAYTYDASGMRTGKTVTKSSGCNYCVYLSCIHKKTQRPNQKIESFLFGPSDRSTTIAMQALPPYGSATQCYAFGTSLTALC